MTETTYEAEMERRFPAIRWRDPLPVTVIGTQAKALACRICIARHGLKAEDVPTLPRTREEFNLHMLRYHSPT